jgi:membrane protein required for colicin V production
MTGLDLFVVALLLFSAAVGFGRGAIREVFAMAALIAASAAAVFGLPISAPFARTYIQTEWIGTVVALIAVFGFTYVVFRLVGSAVARQVQRTNVLGVLDRSLGLAIGLVRGLVVLGALYLMFNAATPQDLRPRWITGAASWPLAANMGRALTALVPQGLDIAGRMKPAFDRAVRESSSDKAEKDR